ncbi:MAG: PorP/SprF family type IX secretion system membrane protein [Bacteroidetes bacterium]|nr:PorP/SprF family type IX secretion system membrane protein [Bacteroidota bacterium]MBU1719219.1 PorP/SprF family type IX secretion system membrane protein [Bacteroidota bacterium]
MRIILRFIVTLIAGLLLSLPGKGQDIHYTLFDTYSLYLNPALAGHFQGTWRFTANHKSQWRSVTLPFTTFSIGIDRHFGFKKNRRDLIGAGFSVNKDKAGDSEFGTVQPAISVSYIRILDMAGTRFFSVGIQNSAAQRTINYSKLKFDSQFNGFTYDPSAISGESFPTENFWFYDLIAGVNYMQIINNYSTWNTGLAISHINKPRQTLFQNNAIKLDSKFVFYTNFLWKVKKGGYVYPTLLYADQGKYRELLIGVQYKSIRNFSSAKYSAIYTGLYFRAGDAINVMLGMDQRKTFFALSYDFNISGLHPASNYLGGIELAIIHKIQKVKVNRIKELPCPIF